MAIQDQLLSVASLTSHWTSSCVFCFQPTAPPSSQTNGTEVPFYAQAPSSNAIQALQPPMPTSSFNSYAPQSETYKTQSQPSISTFDYPSNLQQPGQPNPQQQSVVNQAVTNTQYPMQSTQPTSHLNPVCTSLPQYPASPAYSSQPLPQQFAQPPSQQPATYSPAFANSQPGLLYQAQTQNPAYTSPQPAYASQPGAQPAGYISQAQTSGYAQGSQDVQSPSNMRQPFIPPLQHPAAAAAQARARNLNMQQQQQQQQNSQQLGSFTRQRSSDRVPGKTLTAEEWSALHCPLSLEDDSNFLPTNGPDLPVKPPINFPVSAIQMLK